MNGYRQCIENTVNVERFAGLNFHGLNSFEEYHESCSVNIYLKASYNGAFKCKALRKFSHDNFIGYESAKV